MLQRASIYQPPQVRVTIGDTCFVDMGDSLYSGVTVSFENDRSLLAFLRALADARCHPGVWQTVGGEPGQVPGSSPQGREGRPPSCYHAVCCCETHGPASCPTCREDWQLRRESYDC